MLWVPAARLLVTHCAVPLPPSPTVAQLLIGLPPSVKPTVPVGALPVTVAVKVTIAPTVDGLSELASVVVVLAALPATSVTASMKVVLSLGSGPANMIVCAPLVATEKAILNAAKLVLAGAI